MTKGKILDFILAPVWFVAICCMAIYDLIKHRGR